MRSKPIALALGLLATTACIAPAATFSGALEAGDNTLPSGEYADIHTIRCNQGDILRVTLTAPFDTYLIVRSPSGQQWDNDDAPGRGLNSALTVNCPETGDYQLVASSYQAGATGTYQLEATVTAAGGNVRTGTLQAGDQTLPTGEYVDVFTASGRSGDQVTITMTSTQFDTYLILMAPSGAQWDNDDAEGMGLNSSITMTLPETGTYRIVCTSFAPGQTGQYQVTINGMQ